jgi:hypothetical protein
MTRTEFEAALKADGFVEIETKTLPPRPANGEHGHHYDVRGMVLDGIFTVIQNEKPIHYYPGDSRPAVLFTHPATPFLNPLAGYVPKIFSSDEKNPSSSNAS